MTCKCGKECAGVFAPQSQEWDYEKSPPLLMREVCEHGIITIADGQIVTANIIVTMEPKTEPLSRPIAGNVEVRGRREK